ncbi:hypothetical protein [Bosea sp. (in: a-proteobacteria)]|jgi:hypothetical protein|uniref:hypothetical protein n=1 Tax=Bosea sp. (in: a-proteobacteria) TaxID=1871050 RepID=UPI003F72AC58
MAHRARAIRTLLAGSLLLAALPAAAQEGMLFQKVLRSMGVMPGEGPDIEYRQRPPLVVPPSSALPRPQDPASERTAAWPNDPDVAARRAAAEDTFLPATRREKYRENQRPLLSQEEIRRGRLPGQGSGPGPSRGSDTYEENIGPIRVGKELASRQSADDTSKLVYGSEPQRRHLSDPPTGYRLPAGSAPLGPGRDGPREDRSESTGQKEFAQGLPPPVTR